MEASATSMVADANAKIQKGNFDGLPEGQNGEYKDPVE